MCGNFCWLRCFSHLALQIEKKKLSAGKHGNKPGDVKSLKWIQIRIISYNNTNIRNSIKKKPGIYVFFRVGFKFRRKLRWIESVQRGPFNMTWTNRMADKKKKPNCLPEWKKLGSCTLGTGIDLHWVCCLGEILLLNCFQLKKRSPLADHTPN